MFFFKKKNVPRLDRSEYIYFSKNSVGWMWTVIFAVLKRNLKVFATRLHSPLRTLKTGKRCGMMMIGTIFQIIGSDWYEHILTENHGLKTRCHSKFVKLAAIFSSLGISRGGVYSIIHATHQQIENEDCGISFWAIIHMPRKFRHFLPFCKVLQP